jgi:hypothetical protein
VIGEDATGRVAVVEQSRDSEVGGPTPALCRRPSFSRLGYQDSDRCHARTAHHGACGQTGDAHLDGGEVADGIAGAVH